MLPAPVHDILLYKLRNFLSPQMPQKLLQHKHCITCDKAIPVTEEFCSEECKTSHRLILTRKKRQLLLLWIGAMAVLLIAVVLSLG